MFGVYLVAYDNVWVWYDSWVFYYWFFGNLNVLFVFFVWLCTGMHFVIVIEVLNGFFIIFFIYFGKV